MPGNGHGVTLRVWGEWACFTRPELKVERYSYDVMTPSAARGILEAILWKPAIRWCVEWIDVLAPVQWGSIRRNEVGKKAVAPASSLVKSGGNAALGLFVEDERQQRSATVLRNVDYVVHARFTMTQEAGPEDSPAKFVEMARRRIDKGQCFHRPYLGCREFAASFGPAPMEYKPCAESRDLGFMLYDMNYGVSPATPRFFRARMEGGRVCIPRPDSPEVLG
jgi:CRISPR-associated protein Cas5d